MLDETPGRGSGWLSPRTGVRVLAVAVFSAVLCFSNLLSSPYLGAPGLLSALLPWFYGGSAAAFFASPFLLRWRRVPLGFLVPLLAGVGGALAAGPFAAAPPSGAVGGLLCGASYGFAAVGAVSSFVRRSSPKAVALCVLVSYVLCSAGATAVSLLAPQSSDLSLGALAAFAVLGSCLLAAAGRSGGVAGAVDRSAAADAGDRGGVQEGGRPLRGDWLALLTVVALGLCAMMFSMVVGTDAFGGRMGGSVPAEGVGASAACIALFCAVFYAAVVRCSAKPFAVRYRWAILVLVGGLLVLSVMLLTRFGEGLLPPLVWVCRMFCQCLLVTASIDTARALGRGGLALYCAVVGAMHLASALSPMRALLPDAEVAGVVVLVLCFGLVALALVPQGASSRAPSPGASDGEGTASEAPEDSLSRRACRIGAAHGLSPRECEVFAMLAQGRSGPFICKRLVIAESTVKTHTARIYAKLGVHSKQELIDLLEKDAEG